MSYCRFENTLEDLQDCFDHMDEPELSEGETRARKRLIGVCCAIVDDYGDIEDY